MKTKIFFAIFLILLLVMGCASPPKKERDKLPSQQGEAAKPQPSPGEKLKEIVVPQMEEAKKVPETLLHLCQRFKHPGCPSGLLQGERTQYGHRS